MGEHKELRNTLRRLRAQALQRVALPPNLLRIELRAAGVRPFGVDGAVLRLVGVAEEPRGVGRLRKGDGVLVIVQLCALDECPFTYVRARGSPVNAQA